MIVILLPKHFHVHGIVVKPRNTFSYLGLRTSHQVFELDDFVIDGRAVALLNCIVSCTLLPLVWHADWFTTDCDAVDWQLLSVHHDRHRSQDGAPAHKGLRRYTGWYRRGEK